MKLIILISVVVCCHAAKLDRTYLPPASASTAGGSPGSLTAPGSQSRLPSGAATFRPSGPSGFDQGPQSGSGFNEPQSGSAGFEQSPGTSSFGQTGQPGFEQSSQYSQPGASGPQFGQSGVPNSAQVQGQAFGSPRTGFGKAPAGFSPQEFQPERERASIDRNAEILRYDNQNDGDNFAYSFETSNGISAEESGVATNGVQAQGGYSYTGDDGQQYRVTYTADENGYQPQGDHLPTPHPIPEEILRSIEQNARAAAAGTQEGAYNPEEDFDGNNSIAPQEYSSGATGNQGAAYQGGANQGTIPSYQGAGQPFGQGPSGSYNQPEQTPSAQYGTPNAPGFAKSSGIQGSNQYQPDSNQGALYTQGGPTNTGFSSQRQRGPESRSFEPANSGLVRSGLQGQQDDSGYQYDRPQTPSQYGNQGQLPQQTGVQQLSGSQFNRPQTKGPAGRGFGPTDGPNGSSRPAGPISQGFGSSQINAPTGSAGPKNKGLGPAQTIVPTGQGYSPAGAPQGFSGFPSPATGSPAVSGISGSFNPVEGFSRPNVGSPSYTSAGSSGPGPVSGSSFGRPTGAAPAYNSAGSRPSQGPRLSSNDDQGYVYGPGISSAGTPVRGSGTPTGRVLGSALSSGSPSDTGSQQGSFARPSSPEYSPSNQGSSAPTSSSQGSYVTPNGLVSNTAQTPEGSFIRPNAPSSGSAQDPQGSYFANPNTPSGPSGSSASQQGPFGSAPKYQPASAPKSTMTDSAPYQYNRPGLPGSERGSPSQTGFSRGSQGPQGGSTQGQPGSRPSETFSGPRQPPSFSSEEGYKY